MRKTGFTLMELTLVLLIAAVVAAAVALQVRGPLRNARVSDAIGWLQQYDRTTRTACQMQDRPLQIVVDLTAGKLTRAEASGQALGGPALQLPEGFAIERLLTGGQDVDRGTVRIPCSRQGRCATYALLLRTPGGGRRWLAAAGLTGLWVQPNDEQEAKDILAAAGGGRNAG